MAITGVPSTMDDAGGIVRPHKQRQPVPGHARRAHAVDRDDKVQAGKDGREAGDEHASAAVTTCVFRVTRC